jgi:hypothetical protein
MTGDSLSESLYADLQDQWKRATSEPLEDPLVKSPNLRIVLLPTVIPILVKLALQRCSLNLSEAYHVLVSEQMTWKHNWKGMKQSLLLSMTLDWLLIKAKVTPAILVGGDATEPGEDDADTPFSAHYTPSPLTEAESRQPFVPSWGLQAGQLLDHVEFSRQFMEESRVPAECVYGRRMTTANLTDDYCLSLVNQFNWGYRCITG